VRVGGVVLAAGSSSRLGRPKQLLLYKDKTLVRRMAEEALAAGLSPVVVVLGARAEDVAAELTGLPVRTVHNPAWEAGMGSSLQVGVRALTNVDAALIMLCDQLRVDTAHLKSLVDAFARTGAAIVASGYGGARGVPALFARATFSEFETLTPTQGARGVIAHEPSRVVEVALPGGDEDIDMEADLSRLQGI
jgi:molybdenum cofactor cytidylyltransferase